MTCEKCGSEMIEVSFDVYECPNCGYSLEEDCEWEDIYGVPIGCSTCDSDNYPACKEGCPLIDE